MGHGESFIMGEGHEGTNISPHGSQEEKRKK
jgi:hypothetical protein